MNRRGEGMPRKLSNCVKDRDEELSFFRDLQKREKDEISSLLQPVSNEFEPNGNYGMYRMESGRKGPALEFLAESGKNDYNWLKTPPATPLFPSLEMETNAPEMVVQREIPIIQHLSRFAGNSDGVKANTNKSKSPNPKPKVPQRYKTPIGRPTISSTDKKNAEKCTCHKPENEPCTHARPENEPIKHTRYRKTENRNHSSKIFQSREEANQVSLLQTFQKAWGWIQIQIPNLKVEVYHLLQRPTIPAKIQGFSDGTPPNLRTDRSISATRGRPDIQNRPLPQKQDLNPEARRQSCSPSVNRGRKVDNDGKVR
ncbi:uncharacterized protein Fot_53067 [Forsythia ovata]|uniref:Uncharacterized protein n=1 Tax=Forsythia ovata TaxID=205694 RepID=A0ABD1PHL7_9LAMI